MGESDNISEREGQIIASEVTEVERLRVFSLRESRALTEAKVDAKTRAIQVLQLERVMLEQELAQRSEMLTKLVNDLCARYGLDPRVDRIDVESGRILRGNGAS